MTSWWRPGRRFWTACRCPPFRASPRDHHDRRVDRRDPSAPSRGRGFDLSMAMFADVAAEQVVPAIMALGERDRLDLVVFEAMNTGAGVAASVLGVRAAAFAIGLVPGAYGMLHRPPFRIRRTRGSSGVCRSRPGAASGRADQSCSAQPGARRVRTGRADHPDPHRRLQRPRGGRSGVADCTPRARSGVRHTGHRLLRGRRGAATHPGRPGPARRGRPGQRRAGGRPERPGRAGPAGPGRALRGPVPGAAPGRPGGAPRRDRHCPRGARGGRAAAAAAAGRRPVSQRGAHSRGRGGPGVGRTTPRRPGPSPSGRRRCSGIRRKRRQLDVSRPRSPPCRPRTRWWPTSSR